ncbi:hypothetical protein [Streptomyces sp. 7N604]
MDAIADPGQRAGVNAMLAVTHALLATAEDVRGTSQPMLELQEVIRSGR